MEEIQKACLAHLRNQVAESVRQLWSRVALLRSECEERVSVGRHVNPLNTSASVGGGVSTSISTSVSTSGSGSGSTGAGRSPGAIVQDIVRDICVRLEVEKDAVHAAAVKDASAFLHSFIDTHLIAALPELCALYPCHARVTSLAVWLIRNQAAEQHAALLSFMSSYARRKLGEVSGISAKQLKNVTGALSIPLGRVHEGETDARSGSPSRKVNLALKIGNTAPSSGSVKCRSEGMIVTMNSCFKELQLFFTLDQQSISCSSVEGNPIKPLDLCTFVSKHLNIRCTSTQPSSTPPINNQATERITLLSSTFQNYTARMSEAVHTLVEYLAACVGDFMEDDRIRTDPEPVIPDISDFTSTLHFPTLASAPQIPGLGPGSGSWTAQPVVSWASLTSVKAANTTVPQGNMNITSVSKTRLSKSEILIGVENMRRTMIAMIKWAAKMKTQGDGNLSARLEAGGKLSIQIVKLMTSCIPSLLYLDAFLCSTSTSTSSTYGSPGRRTVEVHIPCVSKGDVNNDLVDRITHNVPTPKGVEEGVSPYGDGDGVGSFLPSWVLIECYTQDIITVSSLSFILTATSRQSTLNYYTSCKNLPLLRVILPTKILDFIGRCYLAV